MYILCPLAWGIYGRKERAHRNPLMEPDYLFALKLIECRAEGVGGCVSVCEREISGSLYPFLPFLSKSSCVSIVKGRWAGGWGGAWMCMAVIQRDSAAAALIEFETALQQLGTKLFSSHFQPYYKLHPIILTPPPPSSVLEAFTRILLSGEDRILSSAASQG